MVSRLLLKKTVVAVIVLGIIDRIYKSNITGNFSDVCNSGIAFGIPIPLWFTVLCSIVLCLYGIFYLCSSKEYFNQDDVVLLYRIACVLLLVGALSNLFDRVMYGCVIDYITLPFVLLHFNIADVCIVGGGLFFLYLNFKKN